MSIELRPGPGPREAAWVPERPGRKLGQPAGFPFLLCLGLLLAAASCGKVGDPLPPIPGEPPAPFDLQSVLSLNQVQLSFSVSQRGIEAVQVFRECGPGTAPAGPTEPVATLGSGDLAPLGAGRFSFETELPPGAGCFYSLRVIFQNGRISGPSSWVRVPAHPERPQP